MFCPTCGLTEDRQVLYCRSCGTDLRAVRTSLVAPETGPGPAASAREEIGRALAARIRDLHDLSELEDALPAIEQFMESPAERRLRRIRAGTICAAIGAGATVFFFLFAMVQHDLFFAPGLGIVLFLIGIGLIINGKFLTVQHGEATALPAPPDEAIRRFMSSPAEQPALASGSPLAPPASVTENTTRHLTGVADQSARKE
jgi:hypothetical protein